MPDTDNPLPPDVVMLVEQDRTIEAIKRLRETTGLGLKEAKDAVDAHRRGGSTSSPGSSVTGPLPPDVVDAMQRGRKIEAIRLLRAHTGMGLKAAKEAVEASAGSFPPLTSGFGSSGLGRLVLFLVVLVGAVLAYRLLVVGA
jgi:ribosomal protein L7/L12